MPVVVGVLSTPEGARALDAAVAEAARRATALVLVPGRVDEPADEALAAAQAAGVEARQAPPSQEGEFAARLVEAAERSGADVVVIGLRRRSPVGKLILGAGAQRILLDAPCPVLAVKPAS
ncbi:universal stress protein [Luteimicrobium sp. DT211]|uniref:universal stress protein n=1 Tax=Luteimicrobium sp. DT211 TaxID=3393412 RepID=UPI003CF77976